MKDRYRYIFSALCAGMLVIACLDTPVRADEEVKSSLDKSQSVEKAEAEANVADEKAGKSEKSPTTGERKKRRLKLPTAGGAGGMLWKMLASLLVISLLGGVAFFVLKRLGPRFRVTPGKKITLVETLSLGPGKLLHLVEIDSQRLLLCSTKTDISLLSEMESSTKVAQTKKFPSNAELEAMGSK